MLQLPEEHSRTRTGDCSRSGVAAGALCVGFSMGQRHMLSQGTRVSHSFSHPRRCGHLELGTALSWQTSLGIQASGSPLAVTTLNKDFLPDVCWGTKELLVENRWCLDSSREELGWSSYHSAHRTQVTLNILWEVVLCVRVCVCVCTQAPGSCEDNARPPPSLPKNPAQQYTCVLPFQLLCVRKVLYA